jgi:hypothetical protein
MINTPYKSSTVIKTENLQIKIIRNEEANIPIPMEIIQIFKTFREKFQSSNIDKINDIIDYAKSNIPNIFSIEIINPSNGNSLIINYD